VKIKHLVYLRRISQALFLLLFVFFLMESRLPGAVFQDYSREIAGPTDIRLNYPVTLFFDMDPLTWLSTTLSTHRWLAGAGWALAVTGLTLFLGRFFCGFICPTGAIRRISGKEKITGPIRIGSAFVDRGRCLPWTGNGACIVCEEVCPTSPKAVVFREADVEGFGAERLRLKQPYVNLRQCVGCGICQNKCPIKGTPAIRVIAAGETRSPKNQILLI